MDRTQLKVGDFVRIDQGYHGPDIFLKVIRTTKTRVVLSNGQIYAMSGHEWGALRDRWGIGGGRMYTTTPEEMQKEILRQNKEHAKYLIENMKKEMLPRLRKIYGNNATMTCGGSVQVIQNMIRHLQIQFDLGE